MSKQEKLDATRLRELLRYEPLSGVFTWLVKPCQNRSIGDVAGNVNECGYRRIRINRMNYLEHRLAWLYMTGDWPMEQIDHINMQRSDNRFSNLRDVTKSVNMQNIKTARPRNSTGLLGVSLAPNSKSKFCAQIQVNKKSKFLGTYATAEDAHAAYVAAKRILHAGNTL